MNLNFLFGNNKKKSLRKTIPRGFQSLKKRTNNEFMFPNQERLFSIEGNKKVINKEMEKIDKKIGFSKDEKEVFSELENNISSIKSIYLEKLKRFKEIGPTEKKKFIQHINNTNFFSSQSFIIFAQKLLWLPNKISLLKKIIKTFKLDEKYSIDFDGNCLLEYTFQQRISSGYFGNVYLVHDKQKNMKIMKVQDIFNSPFFYNIRHTLLPKLDFNLKNLELLFDQEYNIKGEIFNLLKKSIDFVENEYNISRKCGDLGISPKTYEHFYCCNSSLFSFNSVIVMDYVEGVTLNNYFSDYEINLTNYKKIKEKITTIKKKLKKHKIIHNDLHSENILVCSNKKDLELKIIDFGISSIGNDREDEPHTKMSGEESIFNELLKELCISSRLMYWRSDEFLVLKYLFNSFSNNIKN